MMHHPNMHHQPMSGHPPQHMGGHQGMAGHHQMPPHQMHRENRVPLGPGAAGGAMGGHGPSLGMGAAMGVPPQRPPHPIRAMPHHPQAQHHSVPPQQLKPLRRPYAVSGGYGPSGGVMPPPYAQPPPMQPPAPQHLPQRTVVSTPPSTATTNSVPSTVIVPEKAGGDTVIAKASSGATSGQPATDKDIAAQGDTEASRPAAGQANSKEKTPMCLVNELARYNKIKHQYRLTSETGPAHKKVFTVTLRLGDTEEYTAEGSSIKRAQHCAASSALTATRFPPPPPRAPPPHAAAHAHHRHAGAVMPTVELNAMAMKLCQPAIYTAVPPVAGPARMIRRGPMYRAHALLGGGLGGYGAPGLLYRVRVSVGARAWLGEGSTPQAARHDAAARALHDLRPELEAGEGSPAIHDEESGDGSDMLNSEVKSPVSLVHELALKRNLSVLFSVKSERGPPHMRVFITTCTVGDMETEGEGNGKKVSKRRSAERMLDEMRQRWPPALLRARPPHDKRRQQPAKKKPRNLIKPEPSESLDGSGSPLGGADNPISRLAVARHAVRARSPQYRVVEERGAARRREFLVQCDAPPHSATGLGPNKKTAKRRAAMNVLLAMEVSNKAADGVTSPNTNCSSDNNVSPDSKTNCTDSKRREPDTTSGPGSATGTATGGTGGEVRQPVPGVLLMDYHQRSGQPPQPNGVSETSATAGSGGNTPGATDQLMYLSQLLGFTVQFSDFPKRNHGSFLSLVSLSTEPPVMCHGAGPSTRASHEQCARAALRALALMGLDAPPAPATLPATPATDSTQAKQSAASNGVAE